MYPNLQTTKSFWNTAKVIQSETAKSGLRKALKSLNDDWPNLPSSTDEQAFIPPVVHCWMRQIPSTGFWIYYTSSEIGVIVRAVILL